MPTEPATPESLARAGELLRAGGLVAFPTETVYGLGAHALNPAAVAGIFAAKGRPATNPLIVHILGLADAAPLTAGLPEVARRFAEAFWPGPLTLVLPKSVAVPDAVTAGGPTVALRAPAHPVARALLVSAGVPVAAPSANRSGELSPTTAAHVAASLGEIDLILDGGACSGGIESTVVDVSTQTVRLLRPGLIGVADLERVAGGLIDLSAGPRTGALPSPGMLARHYAPRTPLDVAGTEAEFDFLAGVYEAAGRRVARVRFPGSPGEVAARLYAELHGLDAAGYDRLIVLLPPNTDDWRAVRDRLTRAAAE